MVFNPPLQGDFFNIFASDSYFMAYFRKITIIFIFSCIMGFYSVAQNATGIIPVMNFLRSDYSYGTQNWDMTEDMLGKIYVANYKGMMSFDGIRWQHHYLSNFSSVRCLLYDNNTDRIYAGGSNEFGFFSPNEGSGALVYHSLSESLPKNSLNFAEVWDIIRIDSNILFRCDNSIFELKNDVIQRLNLPGRISSSTLIGRVVYIGMEDGRIFSLKDGNIGALHEEGTVGDNKIVAILPYDDKSLLVCTPVAGILKFKEGRMEDFNPEFSDYLKSNQIFCASCRNGVYVFGTVTGGAVIWDSNTRDCHLINKDTGMKNNTVLNARFQRNGNIWLCLDNGLGYVALDSPCRRIIREADFIGAGYAYARLDNLRFFGTNQGLYVQNVTNTGWSLQSPEYSQILQGQVWSITPLDHELFISADFGLFVFAGGKLKKVENIPGAYKTLLISPRDDMALSSTYDSFHVIQKINGEWIDRGKTSGNQGLSGHFSIDEDGNVWVPHWQKGIFKLPFDIEENRFTSCVLFDKEKGLPENENNTFSFFEGTPVVSTYNGFYNIFKENDKVAIHQNLNKLLRPGRKGHLIELSDGTLTLIDEEGLMLINRDADGKLVTKDISGPGLYREIIPGFTDIHKVDQDNLLVSTQSGFTIVNIGGSTPYPHSSKPFVNNIFANQDSLIYKAPLAPENIKDLIIPHNLNSLRFEFAYPECNFGENIEFSSFLENFDKGWAPFSHQSSREFSRLAEGNYVLHLKVKDNYSGEILESAFGFTVNPPWFRTLWAKGVYSIISFIFLVLIFSAVRKKLFNIRQGIEKKKEEEMEDLRKESEKDAILKDMEITELKNTQLEQEIKFKSDELSATTMSLISKNEILRDIGEQISKIKKIAAEGSIASIQKNLSKLQASIEENISKDSDWNAFNKNFDIVYGDYMKRLLKLHPDLTQSEKRLCCYIRMGLSSKEIAPLINISFRSVEMARYRLRKKIDLTPEASLADYLHDI